MAGGGFTGGDALEWVGAALTESNGVDPGLVTLMPGTRGTFVTEDFDEFIVVNFEPLGTFCCTEDDVRRIDGD